MSALVTVPAGALPVGTTVSVYPVTNASALASDVPPGQTYLLSFSVSWEAPGGGAPAATAPITMTITDPSIVAGDVIYAVTSTGVREVGKATVNGTVTVTFTNDPVFLVASVPKITVSSKGVLSHATLPVKLSCVAAPCNGTVSLTESVTVRVKRGKKAHTEKKTLVLGSVAYHVAAGHQTTVKLKVNSLGRKTLARVAHHSLRETLSATVVGGSPVSRTISVS